MCKLKEFSVWEMYGKKHYIIMASSGTFLVSVTK